MLLKHPALCKNEQFFSGRQNKPQVFSRPENLFHMPFRDLKNIPHAKSRPDLQNFHTILNTTLRGCEILKKQSFCMPKKGTSIVKMGHFTYCISK